MNVETSWWEDAFGGVRDTFGGLLDVIGEQAGPFIQTWMQDEFGNTSNPQNAVETPQAPNADVSNSPEVAFGVTQKQLMIGGVALVGAFLLYKKFK